MSQLKSATFEAFALFFSSTVTTDVLHRHDMANNLDKIIASRTHDYYTSETKKPYSRRPKVIRIPDELATEYSSPPCENICPDNCGECCKQFRPVQEQLIDSRIYADVQDTAEVKSLAENYTTTIFSSLRRLQDLLASHENVVLSRWKKKSEAERKAAVLDVAPDMFKQKFPHAHLHHDNFGWIGKRQYRKTYLLPYLTVDNLCDDKSKLLTLLDARARPDPEEWMMFDAEQLHEGYARGCLEVRFHPACVVMHGKNYGRRLVNWNQADAHSWNIVGWPKARLILEAQAELMQFLVKIAEKIIDGYQGVGGTDKWRQDVVLGSFSTSGGQEQWSGLGRMGLIAPSAFEPISLLEVARDRLAVCEDELELLQTDPAYVLAKIDELRKMELSKQLRQLKGDWHWPKMVNTVVCPAVSRARYWQWIVQDLEWICQLYQKYGDYTAGGTLPEEYTVALGSHQRLLINLQTWQVAGFRDAFYSLRSTQKHLKCFQETDTGKAMIALKKDFSDPNYSFKEMIINEPVLWAAYQLQTKVPMLRTCDDNSILYQFLDGAIVTGSAKERAQMDQLTCDLFSDMCALDIIMSSFRQMRPHAIPVDQLTAVSSQRPRNGGDNPSTHCTMKLPGSLSTKEMDNCSSLLKEFANVGWPRGKQNVEWLQHATKSRKALTRFGDEFRATIISFLEEARWPSDAVENSRRWMSLATAPEHVAELERERRMIEDLPLTIKKTTASAFSSAKAEVLEHAKLALQKEEKRKRAVHDPSPAYLPPKAQGAAAPEDLSSHTKTTERIEVGPAAHRMFSRMFRSDSAATASVRWQQVVAAFADAGCSAYHSGGSAVTFKSREGGSIVFHRPHPESDVSPVMLQVFGKRLMKAFGWCSETFVERATASS